MSKLAKLQGPLLTVGQGAPRIGVSREVLRQHCQRGTIKAFDVAAPGATRRQWRITHEALEEFLEKRSNVAESHPTPGQILTELDLPSSGRDYFCEGAEG